VTEPPEDALAALERDANLRPADAAAQALFGAALHARGRAEEAALHYRRALELEPGSADVHNNLGNVFLDLGRTEAALGCFENAVRLAPHDAVVRSNLCHASRLAGRLEAAVAQGERAVALAPGLAAAHNHLGNALAAQGRREAALDCYARALSLDPGYVDALDNLGATLRDLSRPREALRCHRRALALGPERAETHLQLGNACFDLGALREAAESYRRAVALEPHNPAALLAESMLLRRLGRPEEAAASCATALELKPDYAEALSFRGELCADAGAFTLAQSWFERALAVDPGLPGALASIAAHRRMTPADSVWHGAASALLTRGLPVRHRIALHYALGKHDDDLGRYASAFEHFHSANELAKRTSPPYDRVRMTQRVDELVQTFSAARIAGAAGLGNGAASPVFVVGMPRSGTSLCEQILASHPAVCGAGELTFWNAACAAHGAAALDAGTGATVRARLAADYLERLEARGGGRPRVVDKMPMNFLNLGLIHATFPRARIVHMQRDPRDTCLSIYFQHFADQHPYAHDLADLAHYYGQYARLMQHWRRCLPAEALLELPYEGLIEDQAAWTRRLLEFLGLPWDARCLEFHRTERVVITTSKWQVRQKLHAASVGRARHYAPWIGPLRALVA
jgi:tetratricopeptide (TPR) repeat protein